MTELARVIVYDKDGLELVCFYAEVSMAMAFRPMDEITILDLSGTPFTFRIGRKDETRRIDLMVGKVPVVTLWGSRVQSYGAGL